MLPAIAVNGSMKLQKDLIPTADETDDEARPIALRGEPRLQPLRQATAKQRLVGDLVIEPVARQVELRADVVGRHAEPVGQRTRRDQPVRLNPGEDGDVLRRRPADQAQRQQRRTAADDEMHGTEYTYRVDIYSKRDYIALLRRVKQALKAAGFYGLVIDPEVYEQDTGFYHVPIEAKYYEQMEV